jgi:hypothetical protein
VVTPIAIALTSLFDYFIQRGLDFVGNPLIRQLSSLKILDLILISVVIACILWVIFSLLRQWKTHKESRLDVYTHSHLPGKIENYLNKSQDEIDFCEITLESLNHKIPSIQMALERGVTVRILLCDPESDYMEEIENVVDSSGTGLRVEGTLQMLVNKLSKTISNSAKTKLEIKTFKKSFLTHTLRKIGE